MSVVRSILVLPTEITETIVYMTHDIYLYIALGYTTYAKDMIMLNNGPGIVLSQFLEKDDNIRHLLYMRKYVPSDVMLYKAV